jgi:hypothetical protein
VNPWYPRSPGPGDCYGDWTTGVQYYPPPYSYHARISQDLRYDRRGALTIKTTPPDASIYLDRDYQGKTPLVVGSLTRGEHKLILALPGYFPYESTVWVEPGDHTTISVTLNTDTGQYGTITVSSLPAGALVFLNGVFAGETPPSGYLTVPDLNTGSHEIIISHAGYEDYSSTIMLSPGQTSTVNVALKKIEPPDVPVLGISSEPAGAAVYIDNEYKGITPVDLTSLSPGKHPLILSLDGYERYSAMVTTPEGRNTQVHASLVPVTGTTGQIPKPTQSQVPVAGIAAALVGGFLLVRRT